MPVPDRPQASASSATPAEAARLWEGLRAGDARVREAVWEAIRAHAAPYLRQRGTPSSELEDLLHEVYESACRCTARRPDEPPRHFGGFLKGRARGVFSVWARRRREGRRLAPLEDGGEAQQREPGPSETVQRDDERRALRGWIEHCRDRLDAQLYRPVWSLRYESGLDLRQVAEWLGRAYETVAVQVHRANKQMRACLESKGVAP